MVHILTLVDAETLVASRCSHVHQRSLVIMKKKTLTDADVLASISKRDSDIVVIVANTEALCAVPKCPGKILEASACYSAAENFTWYSPRQKPLDEKTKNPTKTGKNKQPIIDSNFN